MRARVLSLVLASALLASCSTTRTLSEGEYRLASNKVEISGDRKLGVSEVTPYIRQQSNSYFIFGWNPFLNVYNWSDGSGKGINGFWEKIGVPPVVFNPMLVQSSVENISKHLEYLGYYDAKVGAKLDTVRRLAKVRYLVETGERMKIDSIVYNVPQGEFSDDFRADSLNMSVRPGDFLSEQALEAESVRGANCFRNLGYYTFNKNHYFFEADTLSGRNVLYYGIREHTRNESQASAAPIVKYRIRNVNIWHPADIKVKESLLRKFNTIKPGALYGEKMVNTTYHRFFALNVFNNVSIEMTPSDSASVDCDIRLSGSDVLGFKLNAELSSNSSGLIGASPQLTFYHKNIFNGGERLNVGFTGNWQFKPGSNIGSTELGVSASISFPQALGFPIERLKGQNIPRTELKTAFNYQNRPEYRRSVASFSYGYTGQIGSRLYYQMFPLQLSLVKLYDISDDFSQTLKENPYLWDSFEDQVDLGLGGMMYYTTDSDIVPKTPYTFARLALDVSGNFLSLFNPVLPVDPASGKHFLMGLPYNQYVKAELSLGKVFRFGRSNGQALAFRLNMGAGRAYGNSTALPFEKQFYCGGAGSMRGWQVRTLGPGYGKINDSFIIPSQTGDVKLEADMEYRFRMFWKLEGALFAEVGNIWYMKDFLNEFPGSLAADWGLGVRVNLDFILLRVDAGFKVHDPSRDAGSRWVGPAGWVSNNGFAVHFGVGYPF